MLIDDLINANQIANLGPDDCARFQARLRAATKFDLAPDFAASADALSAEFTNVAKAIPFCRLPFKSVWVEVAQNARPRFSAADIHVPVMQGRPKRVGFLIDAVDDRLSSFRAHQFWSFYEKDKLPNISELAMKFSPENMTDEYDTRLDSAEDGRILKIESSPEWLKAPKSIRARLHSVLGPEAPDFYTSWGEMYAKGEDEIAKLSYEVSIADWSGESMFLLAMLALLNTRNAHERLPIDVRKINDSRKKRGDPPLAEYSVVRMHRRIRDRVASRGTDASTSSALKWHMVMGHWKVRRTGIFFWHPYGRGSLKKGKVDKSYRVME
jgi:hypothetical protein